MCYAYAAEDEKMEGRDSTGWDGIITIADGKSKYKLV